MRLRVKPLKRKDGESGLASIDRAAMEELGVKSGEFVAIDGCDGRVIARPARSPRRGRRIRRGGPPRDLRDPHPRSDRGDDVDLDELATDTEGYTGADIEAVWRKAAMTAVREHVRAGAAGEQRDVESIELTAAHFEAALEEISPDAAAEFDAETGDFDDVLEKAGGEA
ncbi:hypothetical protein [Halosolutus gelatinilyticus]|uniref:hypothetical protein n=1 Tax=Halosolutus gelatinilyticus TaxID=2931975 RepID=UPI001FF5D99D|nr:hypothetical protein [Halosolutus gelatinilyticus]